MTSAVESVVQERQQEQVDREKTCPLLLRVFCTFERHHPTYNYQKGIFPLTEFQIYTWMDATLREITGLILEVNDEAKEKNTTFDFQLVYPERFAPKYTSREVGTTTCGVRGPDDDKTLGQIKFTIGDYMDVCINPPSLGRNQMGPNMRRGMMGGKPRYRN